MIAVFARIFHTLMDSPLVVTKTSFWCSLIFTSRTRVFDFLMNWPLMLKNTPFWWWLMIALYTWVLDTFMDWSSVSNYSTPIRCLEVTLSAGIFDSFMNPSFVTRETLFVDTTLPQILQSYFLCEESWWVFNSFLDVAWNWHWSHGIIILLFLWIKWHKRQSL